MSATQSKPETPAPAPDSDVPVSLDEMRVKLCRPIEGGKGMIHEIVLKEPKADLLLKHGLPWKQLVSVTEDGEQKFEMDPIPSKMGYFIQEMSDVPLVVLGSLAARDMATLFTCVVQMLSPALDGDNLPN